MDIVYEIMERGASLLDSGCAVVFLWSLLGRRCTVRRNAIYYMMFAVIMILLYIAQDWPDNIIIRPVIMIGLELLYSYIYLEGSLKIKIIYIVIYHLIVTISNVITVYGFYAMLSVDMTILLQPGSYIRMLVLGVNKAMLLLMLIAVVLFIKRKHVEYQEWLMPMLMYSVTIAVVTIFADITLKKQIDDDIMVRFLFVALGLFILSIIISVCAYQLNQQYRYKIDNIVLNAKLSEEKYMQERINNIYEESQILRHDLKRYLVMIQGMLEDGEAESALKYLDQIVGDKFESIRLYKTNSSVVNTVLNEKSDICKKRNIIFDVQISGNVPEDKQIELGIILSNLIDNAIEAEEREQDRRIKVELSDYKGKFVVRICNHISGSVLRLNPMLHTNKADVMQHGFGIKSVKKMVKKMDGIYYNEETQDQFIVNLMV